MKRLITLSAILLFVIVTHAQVELTIETTPGGLKDTLTEEQKQTVTDLTLTGSMDDSDFYLIRDEMPKLKVLDMRKVKVDSIPNNALYNSFRYDCILPESLTYIGDSAFYRQIIYITHRFPKLGENSFGIRSVVEVSHDNLYCKQETLFDNIYSMDGKILYYNAGYNPNIEEGTEIIESHALDRSRIQEIIFPTTLKLIKEFAFIKNIPFFSCQAYKNKICFISKAETPPVLEKNAFMLDNFSDYILIVPDGKIDVYRQADPQWSKFYSIENSSGIDNQKKSHSPIIIIQKENGITIKSEKELSKIQMYTLSGECCYSQNKVGSTTFIPRLSAETIYLLKVIFEDNTTNHLKIIF